MGITRVLITLLLLAPCARGQVIQSREALLFGATQARDRITDLTFTVTARADVDDDPGFPGAQQHETIIMKGGRIYRDYEYGTDAGDAPVRHRRLSSFNGSMSTFNDPRNKWAIVRRDQQRESSANDSLYLSMAMLHDPAPGKEQLSLISLLRARGTRVRPALENLDGALCHVLDFAEDGSTEPEPTLTAWLDTEHGFMVRKLDFYTYKRRVIMEYRVLEAAEIMPGLWLPTKGEKHVHAPFAGGAASFLHIAVDLDEAGSPKLKANTGVADSIFDLHEHLPEGTQVLLSMAGLNISNPGKPDSPPPHSPVEDRPQQHASSSPGGPPTHTLGTSRPGTPAPSAAPDNIRLASPKPSPWWLLAPLLPVAAFLWVRFRKSH